MITRSQLAKFVLSNDPDRWPTKDEMPEADISDIEQVAQANTELEPES